MSLMDIPRVILFSQLSENNGIWSWGNLAWGGKGDNPGQFKTAHGVYAHKNHIYVANRAAGQVVKFTKKGEYILIFLMKFLREVLFVIFLINRNIIF